MSKRTEHRFLLREKVAVALLSVLMVAGTGMAAYRLTQPVQPSPEVDRVCIGFGVPLTPIVIDLWCWERKPKEVAPEPCPVPQTCDPSSQSCPS